MRLHHGLRRVANKGGIISLSDAFGDANGTNLHGSLTDQGPPWSALAGSWTAQSGKAQSLTGGDSILAVDALWPDVDITADLQRGNAIYFRVKDADDWWRLRRWSYNYTTYCNTYYYTYTIQCDGGPCSPNYTGGCGGCSGVCTDCCFCNCFQTSTVCSSFACGSGTADQLSLEKRVAGGSIVQVANIGLATSSAVDKFRVRAVGSEIKAYRGATAGNDGGIPNQVFHTANDAQHQGETLHGVGYGATDNLAHGIDNFALTPVGV